LPRYLNSKQQQQSYGVIVNTADIHSIEQYVTGSQLLQFRSALCSGTVSLTFFKKKGIINVTEFGSVIFPAISPLLLGIPLLLIFGLHRCWSWGQFSCYFLLWMQQDARIFF